MGSLIATFLLAAAASHGGQVATTHIPTKSAATAQAFVRILPGAKVSLSAEPQPEGYKLNPATITVEDGSRRPAKLVEFQ